MKVDHEIFVRTLKIRKITKKEFSNYAKIPYNTVIGWSKKGEVPAYAMVIVKDMAYRKEIEMQDRIN